MSRIAPIFAPDLPSNAIATASERHTVTSYCSSRLEDFTPGQGRTDATAKVGLAHQNAISSRASVTGLDSSGLADAPDSAPALAELAQLDQWVVSKRVRRGDKIDKPPMKLDERGDKIIKCSHSNPADWTTYAAAWDIVRYQIDGAEAVGFVFHEIDPYSGVDFDGCRDPETGVIAAWAKKWIDRLNSYTEISVSGTGVKVIVRGKLPKALIHKLGEHKGIEVYSQQRYFWMTLNHLAGTPTTINEAQAVLDDMAAELDPPKPEPKPIERKITKGEQAAEDMALADCYALAREWLRDHYVLTTELTNGGAKKTRSGYSCPFCKHTHTTTLTIEQRGKVGYSHSPGCRLYSSKGFDVTNVLILRGNYRGFDDMARHLAPHCFPQPKPKDEEKRYTVAERREWHQKRAEERKQAKAARVAEVAAYTAEIATDERLGERERRVWAAHCILFADNAQHCASLARLAAMVYDVDRSEEKHIRAVQRANERLIECGYLERTIRGSEAHRETNYWRPRHRVTQEGAPQQDAENTARDTLRSSDLDLSLEPDLTYERPAGGQPATLDEWEWQADAHGAEELNELHLGEDDQADAIRSAEPITEPLDDLTEKSLGEALTSDLSRKFLINGSQPDDQAAPITVQDGISGPPAEADGIDWADIERRVSEITPEIMLRAVEQERHDPERLWTRGEALTWYADERHKPQARKERTPTEREQDQERCRAKWAKLVEAGQHGRLRKELAILRNTVKARPASHIWADWRISELHAIVAQLPEPAPHTHKPLPLADLPAFLTGESVGGLAHWAPPSQALRHSGCHRPLLSALNYSQEVTR